MEQLYIAAHGHQVLAMPGNQDSIAIAACITQADGTPVSGLLKPNFKVRGLLTGNVHTANSIGLFIDYGDQDPICAGYYALFVKTTDNNIWRAGKYVFAVTVKTPASGRVTAQGRTIAVLDILKSSDL
jgi:hypothetical protein